MVLPSSHTSPGSRMPLPQFGGSVRSAFGTRQATVTTIATIATKRAIVPMVLPTRSTLQRDVNDRTSDGLDVRRRARLARAATIDEVHAGRRHDQRAVRRVRGPGRRFVDGFEGPAREV